MSNGNIPVGYMSDDELERSTLRFRLKHDVPEIVDDILSIFASVGIQFVDPKEMEFGPDDAISDGPNKTVSFKPSVLAAIKRGERRARFTAAHELAHQVLHYGAESKARNSTLRSTDLRPKWLKRYKDSEAHADYWAGAFLMPRTLVQKCQAPDDLAKQANVSLAAAEVRWAQVHGKMGRQTPEDISREIENLRLLATQDAKKRTKRSVLPFERRKELAWQLLSTCADEPPDMARVVDNRFQIYWAFFGQPRPGGWRLNENDEIVAWEDERSR